MHRPHRSVDSAAPAVSLVPDPEPRPPEYSFSTRYRLYLREGEEFAMWMNPILFLRLGRQEGTGFGGSESERRRVLVALFQERLRKLLYIFVHGHGLPELARILWVLGDRSRDRVATELRALDFLATEFRDFPDVPLHETRRALHGLLRTPRPTPAMLAEGLAVFHREFADVLEREASGGAAHRVEGIRPFVEGDYLARDEAYFRPLVALARGLRGAGRDGLRAAFLHGSLATQDYVKGFSDVEILLLLGREAVEDPDRLLALRGLVQHALPCLYRIDPFQHHGIFLASELDLMAYPQSFFPLILFGQCVNLLGECEPLVVRERDSGLERRRAIWDLCYLWRRHHLERSLPRNLYQWKARIGTLLRIPRAYLEARCIYAPRRESIQRAAADFPPDIWSVVEREETRRYEWETLSRRPLGPDRLPDRMVASFWPWFAGHAGGLPRAARRVAGHEQLRDGFRLSEAVLEKLRLEGVLQP